MKKILLVLFGLSFGAVQAQIPDAYYTSNFLKVLNGRYWMSISTPARVDFLCGFGDAVAWYSDISATNPATHEKSMDYWPTGATYGDIELGVTKFYGEPENLSIPIIQAIKIFAMKVHSRPQSAIDAEITFARKFSLSTTVKQPR